MVRFAAWLVTGAVAGAAGGVIAGCYVHFPGVSFRGALPEATVAQRDLAAEMRADVEHLATTIGERNVAHPEKLAAAAEFIERRLIGMGYEVRRQGYGVDGVVCHNLEVELRGASRPEEIVVIGAHYDSVRGSPGADDNASGVAACLALAREFAGGRSRGAEAGPVAPPHRPAPSRTVRFVFFTNEEPPYFWTSRMGSLVYAKACKVRGEEVAAMLSLETLGYHSEEEGSQDYPPPFSLFYPSTGDFIAFVGNTESKDLVAEVVGSFRGEVEYPSEGAAVPMIVPRAGSSDHWSFWKQGWPAVMVTDTAPYRNPNYHKATDAAGTLDYERMGRIVEGLAGVVTALGGA